MKQTDYRRIYELLNRHEILDYDCGQLCSAACCRPDGCYDEEVINEDYLIDDADGEMGIFLYPGEEQMTAPQDWQDYSVENAEDMGFPADWKQVTFVSCGGKAFCKRALRPLQCRLFPLAVHLDENDELSLIYFPDELPYRCPIIERRLTVNEEALADLLEVCRMLLEDERVYELIKSDSRQRILDGQNIVQIWPKKE
ncbi:MAG: hypothetical protein K6A14_06425 [Erysipelotrichaceae bacterium]|nr:hypothetical protein [Erysipelotrichaceae bacterium]